jgi:hypothetical protein
MLENYMTVNECAAEWHKTPEAVKRHIRAGKLNAMKVSGARTATYLVKRTDWARFLAGRPKASAEAESE